MGEEEFISIDEQERRNSERAELKWPITILADYATVEGITLNISVDGIYIRCDEPLLLNETYRMSILPPNHDAIEILGKVIRSEFYGMGEDNTTFGMGVCLVEIPEEEKNALNLLISSDTDF